MSTEAGIPEPDGVGFNAEIKVLVYMSTDGYRWQIRSASRGSDVLGVASQGYSRKDAAFRSLLLSTGGTYETLYRHAHRAYGVYEQGVIRRWRKDEQAGFMGVVPERIFVEFRSKVEREQIEDGSL